MSARGSIHALHVAAHETDAQIVLGTSVPEPSWCDFTTEPNVEV